MTKHAASAKPIDQILLDIARSYGTPTFAYDMERIQTQIQKLKSALPTDLDILYSLKANPAFGICHFIANCGFGADVASIGELITALSAGFAPNRIFIGGPHKSQEILDLVQINHEMTLSIDSTNELEYLAQTNQPCRIVLRLRPDFVSTAVVKIGAGSRFGIMLEDLGACHNYLHSGRLKLVGFHVFSGSQILESKNVIAHLRAAIDLALRACDIVGYGQPEIINLGGGFGIPYSKNERELDLEMIGEELENLTYRIPNTKIVLELGRYFVAQSGWYLTKVVSHQSIDGRPAAVVDGGIHHRSDLCGIGLRTRSVPPLILNNKDLVRQPTDVLGCLCLPDDVLIQSAELPPLYSGDILAFPNAGAYGFSASPLLFLSHQQPAEVAFSKDTITLLRGRQSIESFHNAPQY